MAEPKVDKKAEEKKAYMERRAQFMGPGFRPLGTMISQMREFHQQEQDQAKKAADMILGLAGKGADVSQISGGVELVEKAYGSTARTLLEAASKYPTDFTAGITSEAGKAVMAPVEGPRPGGEFQGPGAPQKPDIGTIGKRIQALPAGVQDMVAGKEFSQGALRQEQGRYYGAAADKAETEAKFAEQISIEELAGKRAETRKRTVDAETAEFNLKHAPTILAKEMGNLDLRAQELRAQIESHRASTQLSGLRALGEIEERNIRKQQLALQETNERRLIVGALNDSIANSGKVLGDKGIQQVMAYVTGKGEFLPDEIMKDAKLKKNTDLLKTVHADLTAGRTQVNRAAEEYEKAVTTGVKKDKRAPEQLRSLQSQMREGNNRMLDGLETLVQSGQLDPMEAIKQYREAAMGISKDGQSVGSVMVLSLAGQNIDRGDIQGVDRLYIDRIARAAGIDPKELRAQMDTVKMEDIINRAKTPEKQGQAVPSGQPARSEVDKEMQRAITQEEQSQEKLRLGTGGIPYTSKMQRETASQYNSQEIAKAKEEFDSFSLNDVEGLGFLESNKVFYTEYLPRLITQGKKAADDYMKANYKIREKTTGGR